MSLHPFLEKQGINKIPSYTKPVDNVLEFLKDSDLKEEYLSKKVRQDFFLFPSVYAANRQPALLKVVLKNGVVISEEAIVYDRYNYEKRLETQYMSVIERFRREAKFDSQFDRIRAKWGIPIDPPWQLFEILSNGEPCVFLPDVIRDPELIKDIKWLCSVTGLQAQANEVFWAVAGHLLFSEMLFYKTGSFQFFFWEPWRVFQVENGENFNLFIELKPSLGYDEWRNIYNLVNSYRTKGFCPGNGAVDSLANLADETSQYGQSLVCSISDVKSREWNCRYTQEIRPLLDEHYGKRFSPKESGLGKKSINALKQVEKLKGTHKKGNYRVKISKKIMDKYIDSKDTEKFYTEEAVRSVERRKDNQRRYE